MAIFLGSRGNAPLFSWWSFSLDVWGVLMTKKFKPFAALSPNFRELNAWEVKFVSGGDGDGSCGDGA
ncbi:hypothetical protein [Variovorax soli]|uniref:Uncharacterized protein n=1 Tax=Variovorax soli TaxID=376815 RepID=A0ABU1N7J2_9BURK|nr:hypothetical protein [Variovorax soli]MDR6534404.1 hypothetical protein [Variovorax soli]